MSKVYLGLGSNLGNREANLRMALRGLTRMSRVEAVSSLYETEAVGGAQGQPAYYNAACLIETGLEPKPLLRFLQSLEEEIGRRPGGPRWGPRPIDLDVLLYEDRVVEQEALVIPHPRLAERGFALAPLSEIGAEERHPVLGKTIVELRQAVSLDGVVRIAEPGWDGVAGHEQRVRL